MKRAYSICRDGIMRTVIRVDVRLREDEVKAAECMAKLEGMTLHEFLRVCMLDGIEESQQHFDFEESKTS